VDYPNLAGKMKNTRQLSVISGQGTSRFSDAESFFDLRLIYEAVKVLPMNSLEKDLS